MLNLRTISRKKSGRSILGSEDGEVVVLAKGG